MANFITIFNGILLRRTFEIASLFFFAVVNPENREA
jgi:hypothetical protein